MRSYNYIIKTSQLFRFNRAIKKLNVLLFKLKCTDLDTFSKMFCYILFLKIKCFTSWLSSLFWWNELQFFSSTFTQEGVDYFENGQFKQGPSFPAGAYPTNLNYPCLTSLDDNTLLVVFGKGRFIKWIFLQLLINNLAYFDFKKKLVPLLQSM